MTAKMLYEGQRVCLSRFTGPAGAQPDRRRYQLTLMLPRAGTGEGVPVACAWTVLTRDELRSVVEALHGAEACEAASADVSTSARTEVRDA
jgi:hypothetical protein